MSAKTYEFPDNCRYSDSDEWVRIEGTEAYVGITDYAQSELSDIVFVEFPDPGTQVETGEAFGVVESVKAVSDLLAPISGEVVAVHDALGEHPEWVNEDPYGRGWIVRIAPEDLDATDGLMSAQEYEKYVDERSES
jgi:glycine cleavage system H protein